MHDLIELESRGLPTAYIATTARVPVVRKHRGAYHLRHAFLPKYLASWRQRGFSPGLHHILARMGIHRALRVAGCKAGDTVYLDDTPVPWEYPNAEQEAKARLPGIGKWSRSADGIRGLETIEIPDPLARLPRDVIAARAESIVAEARTILTGK